MSTTELPIKPFDGMKFVDAWRRQWIFNGSTNTWVFDGVVPNIPLADESTIGLLSSQLKILLDAISSKAGGFGILTKNSFAKNVSYQAGQGGSVCQNGIISGDVVLKSNSLSITCLNSFGQEVTKVCDVNTVEAGGYPSIDINFSDAFVSTLCIEIPGGQGRKGPQGKPGGPGKDGTGDGPQGLPGDPGTDAIGFSNINNIVLELDDSFYSTGVVNLELDRTNSILEVIKGKLNVPDSTVPADQMTAIPITRTLTFQNTSGTATATPTFDYIINKVSNENLDADTDILVYPSSFNPDAEANLRTSEVTKTKLSTIINNIIAKYQDSITQFSQEYDTEIKAFIINEDQAARNALDQLVTQLANLEFAETIDYCMTMQDNGVCGQKVAAQLNNMNSIMKTAFTSMASSLGGISSRMVGIIDAVHSCCKSSSAANAMLMATGEDGIIKADNNLLSNTAITEKIRSMVDENINRQFNGKPPSFITNTIPSSNSSSVSVCNYATQILEASGYGPTDYSGFCSNSTTTKIGNFVLQPGKKLDIRVNNIPLQPGAYFIQYTGGTIFDSSKPRCGYTVGTGQIDFGLVINVEEASVITKIPFPQPALTDPFNINNVINDYLTSTITDYIVGAILKSDNAKLIIESVVNSAAESTGSINITIWNCSAC